MTRKPVEEMRLLLLSEMQIEDSPNCWRYLRFLYFSKAMKSMPDEDEPAWAHRQADRLLHRKTSRCWCKSKEKEASWWSSKSLSMESTCPLTRDAYVMPIIGSSPCSEIESS